MIHLNGILRVGRWLHGGSSLRALVCAAIAAGVPWGSVLAGPVINEIVVNPAGADSGHQLVEIYNTGPSAVDISGWNLCIRHVYKSLPAGTRLEPGATLVVHLNATGGKLAGHFYTGIYVDLNAADSFGLYAPVRTMADFGDPSFIRDFVQWGAGAQAREDVAAAAGLWTAGEFLPLPAEGHSIAYEGSGRGLLHWIEATSPTIAANNVVTPVPISAAPVVLCPGHSALLTVSGEHFLYGARIEASGGMSASGSTWLAGNTLQALLTIEPVARLGEYDVVVTNPGGISATLPNAIRLDSSAPPDAPLGVAIGDVTGDAISLLWSEAAACGSPISGYEIFREGQLLATSTGTVFTDGGLPAGRSFHYRIQATGMAGGISLPSIELCTTTLSTALSLRLPCDGSVASTAAPPSFAWNGGGGLKWRIEFSLDATFTTIVRGTKGWIKTASFTPSPATWLAAQGLSNEKGGGGGDGGGYGYYPDTALSPAPLADDVTMYWRIVMRSKGTKALTTSNSFTLIAR